MATHSDKDDLNIFYKRITITFYLALLFSILFFIGLFVSTDHSLNQTYQDEQVQLATTLFGSSVDGHSLKSVSCMSNKKLDAVICHRKWANGLSLQFKETIYPLKLTSEFYFTFTPGLAGFVEWESGTVAYPPSERVKLLKALIKAKF